MDNINDLIQLNTILNEETSKYKNKLVSEIKKILNVETKAKNSNSVIFNYIIKNSNEKELFAKLIKKLNCIVKTVNLEWNNNLKESMSLKTFKYMDIINEVWDNCELKNFFKNTIFIFVIFKKEFQDTMLVDAKVWKMPTDILESGVKEIWEYTKSLISCGKIISYRDNRGRNITYFPTSGDTKYIHVRPHAQNSNDVYPLPVADIQFGVTFFTKHSFWLNSSFIKKIVVDRKYYE